MGDARQPVRVNITHFQQTRTEPAFPDSPIPLAVEEEERDPLRHACHQRDEAHDPSLAETPPSDNATHEKDGEDQGPKHRRHDCGVPRKLLRLIPIARVRDLVLDVLEVPTPEFGDGEGLGAVAEEAGFAQRRRRRPFRDRPRRRHGRGAALTRGGDGGGGGGGGCRVVGGGGGGLVSRRGVGVGRRGGAIGVGRNSSSIRMSRRLCAVSVSRNSSSIRMSRRICAVTMSCRRGSAIGVRSGLVGHGRGRRQLPAIAAGGPRVQEQESAVAVLVLVIELDEGAARRRHDGQHQRRQTDSD